MSSVVRVAADPVGDVLRFEEHPLKPIFAPKTVAVLGATEKEGSVGRTLLWNLMSNPFGGTIYPVNPKRSNVLGIRAYSSIAAVPETVDLAVIVTPAPTVPALIAECVAAKVKSSIIISAGFKELGPPGVELERQVIENARKGKLRIIGPNCLGVMCPPSGLNASFGNVMPRSGNVGFISQSGALVTAVLDWSIKQQVGFSAFVSIGSMLDVDWGDLIDYLGNDPRTRSIVIYMESIGNARSFLSAAREVALNKPIIVIKAGRTAAAAKAAASHTGSMTGSDDVLDAAFKRAGVLRVDSIAELFDMSDVLAKQPLPRGPKLTILTNAGGPGVLATDALIQTGGQLAEITPETIEKLNPHLPGPWSRSNPIDILGDAPAERYAKSLEIAAQDPNSDGLLVILTPQSMTEPTQTAEALRPYAKIDGKPLLASWMGGPDVEGGVDILNRANIPTYPYPDMAARSFTYMVQYQRNLEALYETPCLEAEDSDDQPDRERAAALMARIRADGRTLLTEAESKELLEAYRIPTTPMRVAPTPEAAVAAAEELGFPVVVKLHSTTITHKTDVGGVKLNLGDAEAVTRAFNDIQTSVAEKADPAGFEGVTVQPMVKLDGYEIILGSSPDPQFGPVMLFGMGGQLVEVFKDRALGLPPLTTTLARRMLEETKIYKALQGVRGRASVDLPALERIMVRFSQMLVEQPQIKECDINPMIASAEQLLALDARVVLHEDCPDVLAALPRPAIRPYPIQYITSLTLADDTEVLLRPIRPDDEPRIVAFHRTLSDQSVYLRYGDKLNFQQRTTHQRLTRVCFVDYDREMMMVATVRGPDSQRQIIGVGRLSRIHGTNDGKFALLISDAWQGKGLGTQMLEALLRIAREEKMTRLTASILPEHDGMQTLCKRLGFQLVRQENHPFVLAEMDLT